MLLHIGAYEKAALETIVETTYESRFFAGCTVP